MMSMPLPSVMTDTHPEPSPPGGRLVTPDGRALPLESTSLGVVARGGIARVVLEQRFRNPHDEPLTVRYQVPLPAEGAVGGYAFTIGERRVVGEVDRNEQARERFEQAIIEGRSAALLEQERSSLFTQDVGNIPPGETVVVELGIDQKLRWLAEGRWEWRFPTVVAPRYLGAAGRVADADRVSVGVADRQLSPRASMQLRIDEPLAGQARPESTSHPLVVSRDGSATEVAFRSEAGVRLDRDIVVAWSVAGSDVATQLRVAPGDSTDAAYGLLTVLPPQQERSSSELPRDLCILIDASGSMHGEPLEQARRVSLALVDSLREQDSLTLISFAMRPRQWRNRPVRATAKARADARKWLAALEAGGGTEMQSGIVAALEPLRPDAQRQVVLISDGLIGFEDEIVGTILERLPTGSRVHTVGVGSAVNRSLTGPAARAGRGHEAILGIGEDPERVAARLVAHTAAPIVVDLELSGTALEAFAPARLPDLFAGSPALISVKLAPAGGELWVRGETAAGPWERCIEVPAVDAAAPQPELAALFGRETVEDLEMRRAAGERGLDEQVEALGLRFQIATRLTSWVAVSEDPTVDPRDPSRRQRVPHELPYGMSVERLGLRGWGAPRSLTQAGVLGWGVGRGAGPAFRAMAAPPPPAAMAPPRAAPAPPPPPGAAAPRAAARPRPPAKKRKVEVEEERALQLEDSLAAPPPTKGLGRRLLDGLRRVFTGSQEVTVDGRVLLQQQDLLSIEFVAPVDLDWHPGDIALALSDGTEISVELVEQVSTRPGPIAVGQSVRLTLRWEGGSLGASPITACVVSGRTLICINL